MKKFLILFFAAITITACDWNDDPQILGYSEIEIDQDGKYACQVNNFYCYIDSVLTEKDGAKCYEEPILGKDVTVFTLDINDGVYFYRGLASTQEIKEVYFQDDDSNLRKNGMLVFLGIFLFFCYFFYRLL